MPESDEHKKLVSSLINAFIKKGYEILNARSEGYPDPYKIGRHEPDIIAKTNEGLIVLGEAKISDDFASDISKEQFLDFSQRQMAEGLLKGQPVPLNIIINSKNDLPELRKILEELGLKSKLDKNIILWYLN